MSIQQLLTRVSILLTLLLSLLIPATGVQAQSGGTTVGGPIFSDTTWTAANSPYSATNSVQVMNGATLTIEPGVTVRFAQGKALAVSGQLIARGAANNPIRFTGANAIAGYWGFIKFEADSVDATYDDNGVYTGGSILQHTLVEYAGSADNNSGAIVTNQASPYLDHVTINQSARNGIYLNQGHARVTNSTITDSSGYGIYAYAVFSLITGNIIESSGNGGIYIYDADAVVEHNIIRNNNSYGAYCSGVRLRYNKIGSIWIARSYENG